MNLPKRLLAMVASLTLLAFIAGASAGVVAARLLSPRLQIRTTMEGMSRVLDRLDLTTEQRRLADSIVSRNEPRSRQVLVELGERLRLIADSVDAELRAVLTPDQQRRLDSMHAEPRFLLKRKTVTPRGQTVDTLLDTGSTPRRP